MSDVENKIARSNLNRLLESSREITTHAKKAKVVDAKEVMRSQVTAWVMYTYVVTVCGAMVLLLLHGWKSGNYESAFTLMLDLLKTLVLPVVTFVIGHYYGSNER